jgi:HAE1 family hydrophobic/amphiphilic exporter-1
LSKSSRRSPLATPTFITNDQSVFTKAAVHAVQEHLILGSVLAALVVLVFLWNWRSTVISALAIPTSIVATFALMYSQGFTLNVITLLALTLAVGIVIDDAILVIENIYRFLDEKGMKPKEAALAATSEIGLAVLATTLSLVAVFLPVAFMTGIVGRLPEQLRPDHGVRHHRLAVRRRSRSRPMLASRWLKAPKKSAVDKDKAHTAHGSSKKSGLFGRIENFYAAVLHWSLHHRWVVVLLCIGTLLTTVPMAMRVGGNFLPDEDESQFIVSVRIKEGSNLATTQKLLSQIADDVRKFPEVTDTIITVGSDEQQTQNKGDILVKMKDISERKTDTTQFALMARARQLLKENYSPNLRTLVSPPSAFGGGAEAGLQFVITGPDNQVLADAANKIVDGLKKTPGVADADTSVIIGKPELSATVDRTRAGDLGVGIGDVASTLRILVAGEDVTDFPQNGEQYDINVRALPQYRSDASLNLFAVPTTNPAVGSVTLDQVTKFKEGSAPSTVERYSRQRSVTISANLVPGTSAQTIQGNVLNLLKEQNLGTQYQGQFIGQSRELGKTFVAFGVAFLLSIIFMYLILAAQFESWVYPFTILISLPLTVPFAIFSLLVTGNSLNIYSLLGILVLFGIVKKNSILQVDHANQLRKAGTPGKRRWYWPARTDCVPF